MKLRAVICYGNDKIKNKYNNIIKLTK